MAGINDLVNEFKKKHPELDIGPQINPIPVPQNGPLYEDDDYVVILDDASFINRKIKSSKFQGPGILKAYAPWCPHCRDKAVAIRSLAEILHDKGSESAVYVIDVQVNNYTSQALGLQFLPTFYLVDDNGKVGEAIKVNSVEDLEQYLD